MTSKIVGGFVGFGKAAKNVRAKIYDSSNFLDFVRTNITHNPQKQCGEMKMMAGSSEMNRSIISWSQPILVPCSTPKEIT